MLIETEKSDYAQYEFRSIFCNNDMRDFSRTIILPEVKAKLTKRTSGTILILCVTESKVGKGGGKLRIAQG